VDKLQLKVKAYKKQAEEAVSAELFLTFCNHWVEIYKRSGLPSSLE